MSITHPELTRPVGNVPVARSERWELALTATGILPLGGEDLHRVHPKLWPSRSVAVGALKDKPPPRLTSLGRDYIIAGYRRKGLKGRSTRALVDVRRHPEARAALTAALGPLAWFEVLEPVKKAPSVPVAEQPRVDEVTYRKLAAQIPLVSSAGTRKRNLAALAEWRKFTGTTGDYDVIGPELNSECSHRTTLADFSDYSRERLGAGFANRMSGLKKVRLIYLEMIAIERPAANPVDDDVLSFGQALKIILRELDMTITEAARTFGTNSISPWTRDVYRLCTPKAVQIARKIENIAGRPGFLTRFAQHRAHVTPVADFSNHIDPYRQMFARARSRYRADLATPELRHIKEALDECIRFKVMPVPPPGMHRNKKWSRNKEGRHPSGEKFTTHVESFFGWLMLPSSEDPKLSGAGLKPEQLSFGLLGCQELTIRFLGFRATRVELDEGQFWGGALITFEVLSSLCGKNGWLRQTEERWLPLLADQLPRLGIDSKSSIGQDYFRRQHEAMLKWRSDADVDHNCSRLRNPWVTCKPFLDAQSPMKEYIFPLIRNMVADRPSEGAPLLKRQAHERDIMMIVAFFAIPLRALNWRLCEIGKNLYRDHSGQWILYVTREEFKNRNVLKKDFQFRIRLPGWSQAFFSHYIDNILADIPKDINGRQWLLPSLTNSAGKVHASTTAGEALTGNNLALVFAGVFSLYFGYALRPHAARHIVATDYLKADPRNLAIISVLLNDSPETVAHEYASLITQDYATPFGLHMDEKASCVLIDATDKINTDDVQLLNCDKSDNQVRRGRSKFL